MKYKILVSGGNSALLRDFFVSAVDFSCMSTSTYWADLCAHCELFKPDAFVCIVEYVDIPLITQIKRLKATEEYGSIPVILVTDEDSHEHYVAENEKERFVDLLLSRPITIGNISERILKLFRSIEEEKEKIIKEREEAARRATEELQRLSRGSRKHILIIDDDKNILKLLKSALEDRYDVTAIANGKMALKFLETKTPDLIFLDYQMPVMNGPEVFRAIKKSSSLANIPIVFLTGIAEREKITEVISLKPQGYLLKPINMERVNEKIKALLEEEEA